MDKFNIPPDLTECDDLQKLLGEVKDAWLELTIKMATHHKPPLIKSPKVRRVS